MLVGKVVEGDKVLGGWGLMEHPSEARQGRMVNGSPPLQLQVGSDGIGMVDAFVGCRKGRHAIYSLGRQLLMGGIAAD